MIKGRFDIRNDAPYVEAMVVLLDTGNGQQLRGLISFLIDTGADRTVIGAVDVWRLDINPPDNTRLTVMTMAGSRELLEMSGLVLFTDDDRLFAFETTLLIDTSVDDASGLPSILGRDILNRLVLHMTHDQDIGTVTLQPTSADHIFDLEGGRWLADRRVSERQPRLDLVAAIRGSQAFKTPTGNEPG